MSAAGRMKAMRSKRRDQHLREIRLSLPDARSQAVRDRIARQIEAFDRTDEDEAMRWIEAVSDFDNDASR